MKHLSIFIHSYCGFLNKLKIIKYLKLFMNTQKKWVSKNNESILRGLELHAFASTSLATLVIDEFSKIVLINNAGLEFFKENENNFQFESNSFKADHLYQKSIIECFPFMADYKDFFQMIENLPFTSDIQLGKNTFQITIRAINVFDVGFIGNLVEWKNVTADRFCATQDQENSNLVSAIERVNSVTLIDLEGRFIRVNDNFCKITGYSTDELEGKEYKCLVLQKNIENGEYADFLNNLRNGQFVSGRFPRLAKDGNVIWLEASYSPIFDSFGEPVKIVEYAIEITQQVALEKESATLALVANETDNSVIITDSEGLIEYVNLGFTKLTGYFLHEVAGKKPGDVLQGPESNLSTINEIRKKIEMLEPFSGEILNYNKDGNSYWITLNINPIFNNEGELIKYVSVQTNITDVKTKQIEINARLEAISRSTSVIEMTADGKVIKANDQACMILNCTQEEIFNCDYRALIKQCVSVDKNSLIPFNEQWNKLLQGEFISGQYEVKFKSDSQLWIQASFNPILNIEGKVTRIIQYATEITEQYQQMLSLKEAVTATKFVIDGASQGNLSRRIDLENKSGALANLCEGINALMDKFSDIVGTLSTASQAITEACAEIASGNNELSQRTEKQAANLEETAASMEQLSNAVHLNANHASEAFKMADNASKVASKGGQLMGVVVNTMADINKSARKIEDIISVIDTIAFQTNILALNAAVEAARAGEQGRGFAVVAGEVRNLANRSATAAKEIKILINESVTKTSEGTSQVEAAGDTMFDIVNSVTNFTEIMNSITVASNQQSEEIDQTKAAINTIDEVTQQNAALVEQAASSAQLLFDQANQLLQLVSSFEIQNDEISIVNESRIEQKTHHKRNLYVA